MVKGSELKSKLRCISDTTLESDFGDLELDNSAAVWRPGAAIVKHFKWPSTIAYCVFSERE